MFRNLLIRVFEGADSDFVFYVGSSSDRGDHRFLSNAGGSVLHTKFANPAIRRVTHQISASHLLMPSLVSYRRRYFRQLPSVFQANEPMLSAASEARRLQNPSEDQVLAFMG